MIANKQISSLVLILLVSLAALSCTDKSSEVLDTESDFKKAVEEPVKLNDHTQTPVIHSLKAPDEAENSAPNKLNAKVISKDELEPTLADRKKWHNKLAWDKSCEQGYGISLVNKAIKLSDLRQVEITVVFISTLWMMHVY